MLYHFHIRFLVALVLLWTVATNTVRADVTGGYMTGQPTWVAYIHLTQAGSKVAGYIQYVYADARNITQTRKSDIHGAVNGNKVALKLDSFLGYGGKDANGEKRSGKLVLEFPTTSGHVQTYTFSQTTTKAWNQAVTAFQNRWAQTISTARTSATVATRKHWLEEQDNKIVLAIFDRQGKLAGRLYELEIAKGELKKWQEEAKARQGLYEEAKAVADKMKRLRQLQTKLSRGRVTAMS